MIREQYRDITTLWWDVMQRALFSPDQTLDAIYQPLRVMSFNNVLTANSCAFNLDMSLVGFTKGRWTRFITQYVAKDEWAAWLDRLPNLRHSIDNLLRVKQGKAGHTWGECFLGISYRRSPPTVTLFSRVGTLPTTATLELILSYQCAKAVEARLHVPMEEIQFTWFAGSLQWSAMYILPFLVQTNLLASIEDWINSPLAPMVLNRLERISPTHKFGPMKRMHRRVDQIGLGILPPVDIDSLPFPGGKQP